MKEQIAAKLKVFLDTVDKDTLDKAVENRLESDMLNCYTWDDYSYVVKDYVNIIVDLLEKLQKGATSEELAEYIANEAQRTANRLVREVIEVEDFLD